jgi:hypothetical protein
MRGLNYRDFASMFSYVVAFFYLRRCLKFQQQMLFHLNIPQLFVSFHCVSRLVLLFNDCSAGYSIKQAKQLLVRMLIEIIQKQCLNVMRAS